MSTEPRITLADNEVGHQPEETANNGPMTTYEDWKASAQTVKPHQTMDVVQNGLSALINIVADMQERLAKLEAERSTPHAIDHAIEEAVSGIDWEGHATEALAECDASSYAQDAIEAASLDIDLSGQAEEAVDDAVTSGYVEAAIETAVERIDVEKLVQDMLSNYRLDLVENLD
jgi:hypothetical protein